MKKEKLYLTLLFFIFACLFLQSCTADQMPQKNEIQPSTNGSQINDNNLNGGKS